MTAASFWLLRHYVGGGNPSIVCEEEKSATERAVSFDAATNGARRERETEEVRWLRASRDPHYRVPQKSFLQVC